MYQWMTIMLAMAASILGASWRLGERKVPAGRLAAALLAAGGVWAALHPRWPEGSGLLALAAGLLVALAAGLGKREQLLPEACWYLCAGAALAPMAGEEDWRGGLYLAVAALFAVISLRGGERRSGGPMEFYQERRGVYAAVSAAPCVVLLPEALLLAVCRGGGLVLHGVFLLLFGVGLWLQEELCRRIRAEELTRAMERWQRESQDYINTIRAQRHDFNLHLHAISGLLAGGEYEKCGDYVSGLVAQANAVNDIMPVNDAVVGSMLYNMREEARRRGSEIYYEITCDMADVLCSGFECNKIIGNLLQNAIDALDTPEDKAYGIRLSIFKRRGNTVIISENRFAGDPDEIAAVFEPGYSTKKGHEGIGLSMALRTAQRYGGRVYPEFDGEVIRFVVNIPNRVNLPEGGRRNDDQDGDPG